MGGKKNEIMRQKMNEKQIDILSRPFAAELIQQRRGPGGQSLSYVSGSEYIRRLNEAFNCEWTFEIVEHQRFTSEVVVLGRITIDGVVKSAFGGSSIKMSRQSDEPISLADDLKAAATDALKKASSLFGIGLHLYSQPPQQPSQQPSQQPPQQPPQQQLQPQMISEKQVGMVNFVAKKLNLNESEIAEIALESFGVNVDKMTKNEGSKLIAILQRRV